MCANEVLVKQYTDDNGDLIEINRIVANSNVKFQIYYGVKYRADGVKTYSMRAGMFDCMEDAVATVHQHRPCAR